MKTHSAPGLYGQLAVMMRMVMMRMMMSMVMVMMKHDDLFSSRAPWTTLEVYESLGLLIPVIKAVISGDNEGREIAALVWVTYPPAMNPRVARRRLMFPQSIMALTFFLRLNPSVE